MSQASTKVRVFFWIAVALQAYFGFSLLDALIFKGNVFSIVGLITVIFAVWGDTMILKTVQNKKKYSLKLGWILAYLPLLLLIVLFFVTLLAFSLMG